ncbi:DoxX family protein [Paenibacillus chondroitinus]|uniref:DoxX family protein n=1 Tax=Paenibacillus chondroitinus TaxID=59842 RepID=A0ABU6DLS3_9BACL|nr:MULTISPECIES: DoxX family protein [Paenibacillus]MCY9657168.1 DoxX family protein [Paenibacillus anseongense]MEB4798451.1 DoxX family protein [Paenibacillus chondroitinus]
MKTTYWISTILAAGLLFLGGILFITHGEHQIEEMKHLGYPVYILTFLGIGRILGAIAIVVPRFPRLKEWAYAGFVIDLLAASASHAYAGDSFAPITTPLVFLVLSLVSWATRPPSRKLVAHIKSL